MTFAANQEKEPEKKQNKEAFTAWGKEVGGLRAGLGYRPGGDKRSYSHGETVKVVVRVRNVGNEAVDFKHIWAFFMNPPTITDPDGKPLQLPRVAAEGLQRPRGARVTVKRSRALRMGV